MKNGDKPISPCKIVVGTFPTQREVQTNGLTKREYFAALAMQAVLSKPNLYVSAEDMADGACKYADALLLELSKPTTDEA
jgi:hypothetical protein